MFVAMALCLPIAWLQQRWKARRKHQSQQHKQADAEDSNETHDLEAQQSATGAAAASAAVFKAAAINALAAASTGGAAADAPSGSTATDGDLIEPLLTNRELQQHSQHVDRLVQEQHGGTPSGVSGRDNSNGNGNGSGSRKMSKMQEALLLCVPTGFDLAATTLMNVGLLYVAASGECTRYIVWAGECTRYGIGLLPAQPLLDLACHRVAQRGTECRQQCREGLTA